MLVSLVIVGIICLFSPSQDFLGAHAIKEMKSAVKETIKDSSREKQILTAVEEIEQEFKQFSKEIEEPQKELSQLQAQYDSTPQDFQKIIEQLGTARNKAQQNLLEARFKMKQLMTRDEWQAIFQPESDKTVK